MNGTKKFLTSAIGTALFCAPLVLSAAHLSNSKASLSSDMNIGVAGKAVVNYIKGKRSWAANASVEGLPDGTYSYEVRINEEAPHFVCEFDSFGGEETGCSNSQFDLGGFGEALILDDMGNIVAKGDFARRGGARVSNS